MVRTTPRSTLFPYTTLFRSGGGTKRKLKPMNQVSSAPSKSGGGTTDELKVGYNVEHDRFGKGKVTALVGKGSDQKATVFFPRVGQKTLILKFAKLTVVE